MHIVNVPSFPHIGNMVGGFGRIALKWPQCFRRRLGRNSLMRYLRSIYGKLYGIGVIRGKNCQNSICILAEQIGLQ